MRSIKRIRGRPRISWFLVSAQSSAAMAWFVRTVWLTSKKANGESGFSPYPPLPIYANLIRFANMDFPFVSTLQDEKVKIIKISYDIICRWCINLLQRINSYSPELRASIERFLLEFFIPKFHLPAHGPSCHTRYSFNYRPGVGRTHGENIESGWAHTNPAAVATREMGPGARHSALDSHWGGWNWKKIIGFGT